PTWDDLPRVVRALIAERCGGDVVAAESMGAGFTPGFASRLRLADGRRAFVKAADDATRQLFADSYREEIRKLEALPDAIPAPRLRWCHDADGWVILGFDDVAARHPERPWRPDQLALVLATIGVLVSAHGDGVDADAWLPRCATTRDTDADIVDGTLALLAGYFWASSSRSAPETSPWLRIHQRWYAVATTDWLARRRGWQ
ncbi:MAG TPA: hypothetical protein VFR22_09925, partial [Nocardioidaceae bacterium]|nr:hypothetical protein [Nocardioidaceae bacterium]